MAYDASEVGYPFKNGRTLWETCNGLLRQVILRCPRVPSTEMRTT